MAFKQLEAERDVPPISDPRQPPGRGIEPPDGRALPDPPTAPAKSKRFHGSVVLDTARVGRDARKIAEEVIAHLSGLLIFPK